VSRVPETAVLLACVAVYLLLLQGLAFVDPLWGAVTEDRAYEEMAHARTYPAQMKTWAAPPGPLRDVAWSGVAGPVFALLAAVLVLGVVSAWIRGRSDRLERASDLAFRVALLGLLTGLAGATLGFLHLWTQWETVEETLGRHIAVSRYPDIAAMLSSMRLGAAIGMIGLLASWALRWQAKRRG
jgi:hypothetical protein